MTMREKVARALCACDGKDPDYTGLGMCGDVAWMFYLGKADAAIAAMRDPTEAMVEAGFEDYPTVWTAAVTPEDRVGIWQAMIDAAGAEE